MGVPLPHTYSVDFSNSIYGESKKMIGDDTGVTIPDEYFIPGQTIFAWVVISGEDSRETVYEVRIPISLRARPTDETPTPQQQSIIDQLIAEMDTAVDSAEAAKEAIENLGVEAETLEPGSDATVEKAVDPETGAVTLTFGIPEGADGISPQISSETITGGHRITIIDADHPQGITVDVMDGTNGTDGRGIVSVEKTGTAGLVDTYTITYTDGTTATFTVTNGKDGDPGKPGQDGVSPTVTTEQIEGGAVITVTDLHGAHAVTVYNGADGRGISNAALNNDYTLTITYTDGTSYTTPSIRGAQGRGIVSITKIGSSGLVDAYMITYSDGDPSMFYVTNGADGISPTVEVAPITGGYRITFTDQNGAHSFDLMNGVNGISPDVTIESITGGNRVTITDAEHPAGQSFDVMDGPAGPGVVSGGTQGQMLVKKSGTDYDTEWGDPPSVPVQDVQINGVSVLDAQGVANVPRANTTTFGAVSIASSSYVKAGNEVSRVLCPWLQHESAFYGLAKAAGADMASSSNAVGTYTEEAKKAICAMIGVKYDAPFRLIKTITINEEIAYIYVTTDANGEAISLDEVTILFEDVVSSGNGAGGISVNGGNSPVGDNRYLAASNLCSTTAQTRIAHICRRGGKMFGEITANTVANNYTPVSMGSSKNATGIIDCDKITEICIGSLNAHKFTSGTVTIYGR